MSDAEQAPRSAGPGAGAGSAKVVTVTVVDPFCKGNVEVEVDKPNTTSSSDVSLKSSVSATITPSVHIIAPATTAATVTFAATLTGSGTSASKVTFTATVKQSGPPHNLDRKVNVNCKPASDEKHPQVIGILVASPFCRGDVRVEVVKPDPKAAATVTLTSSVGDTNISPASHVISKDATTATVWFAVSLPAQTKAQTATFTAKVTQEGYAVHSEQTEVDVRCEPAVAPAGQGCDPEPPRPRGYC